MENPFTRTISCWLDGPLKSSLARTAGLWLAVLLLWGPAAPIHAQSLLDSAGSGAGFMGDGKTPWTIRADKLTYEAKTRTYEAEGNVRITSGDRIITADWAQVNLTERQATLSGGVRIRYGDDWLTGQRVIWNLDTETGWVDGGTVYFSDNGFYLTGKNITKRGPSQYHVAQGIITTCDPASPDWSISCRDLDVKVNGMGWAKHSTLRLGKVPIFYTPFAYFPMNRERQSGFLMPVFGSSNLHGTYYEQPFFWAFRPDMDLTFYANYMGKRGLMGGLEYEINHASLGRGAWLLHYLDDQADEQDLADQGYSYEGNERYWLRARHSVNLPHEIQAFLDLDFVSDKNFLNEFQSGSVALESTNRTFRRVSRRELLNDETVTVRESSLYLLKRTESAVASMDVHYWDQLDRTRDETTLQQLPQFRASVVPSPLGPWPLYYTVDTSAVHYWRPEGDKGLRADLLPRIYAPLHPWSHLALEPSAGLRATFYQVDWKDDQEQAFQTRWVPDFQMEASSRLERIYRLDSAAVQHVIRPELLFTWVPEVDQDDLPSFDGVDRIGKQNTLRYGFSSFWVVKKEVQPEQGEPYTTYREWARFRVRQAYLLDDDVEEPLIETKAGERFSDIDMELDVTPSPFVNVSYDLLYSPHDQKPTLHDLSVGLRSTRRDSLHLTYRYRQDTTIDELITSFHVKILPNLSLSTYYDYSFQKEEVFEQSYSLAYRHGCWGLRFGYREEGEDREFTFALTLVGLGEVGSTLSQEGSLSVEGDF
ncbi:LPS-assembly protein [Desulfacinum hydrothermale DSM 13146]|uniref:LPS-assembly protein n=1 Tax=Desulfacinum hydrothermale DSM 13146 TaxID=1121390 RepID=A0A1W1XVC1_9BACT|nr:LPS assembly protein LptD [Desulfacinum hydrothermale]SMC27794.1 LPS-assembly protein [Desulfacinum hydrothermale DSM 13146]